MKMQAVVCPSCKGDEMELYSTEIHNPSMHAVHGGSDTFAADELIRRAGKKPGNSVTMFFQCRGCDVLHAVHYVTDGDKTVRIVTAGYLD